MQTPGLSAPNMPVSVDAARERLAGGRGLCCLGGPGSVPSTRRAKPVQMGAGSHGLTGPCRFRAIYQYRPQNEDELELHEGDRVDVMQQCDDGWFVGTFAGWGEEGRCYPWECWGEQDRSSQ